MDGTSLGLRSGPGPESWVIPAWSRLARGFSRECAKALSEQATHKAEYDALWERPDVLSDFRTSRSPVSCALRSPYGESLLPALWPALLHESDVYRRHVNKVVSINDTVKEVQELVLGCERAVRGRLRYRLSHELGNPADELRRLINDLNPKQYWARAFSPPEKHHDVDVLYPDRKLICESEKPFERLLCPDFLWQERQLDTRFQVRVGAIFRYFDAQLSLKTIARLVLMTYVCLDFVRIGRVRRHGKIYDSWIVANSSPGRGLTINATYEKLLDAGMR
jgi:hypothetical protein